MSRDRTTCSSSGETLAVDEFEAGVCSDCIADAEDRERRDADRWGLPTANEGDE